MVELRKRSEAGGTGTETRVSCGVDGVKAGDGFVVVSDAGQSVSVTWGDEFFQVVQYNGFRVGPFQATTVVREGETIADATLRAHRALAEAARRIRTEKSREHLDALKELGIGHR